MGARQAHEALSARMADLRGADKAARDARRQAGLERMFQRADADGDGRVTEAEFDAAMARVMERRGGDHGERRGPGFWRG